MDIEPIVDVQYDRAYGEVHEYQVLEGLNVTAGGSTKTLKSRTKTAFRHNDGYRLTVDADIFFNEPDITVETAYDDVDEYGYSQWQFDSFERLSAWLTANATFLG